MNAKESIEQLKSLIEHFNNGGNDFNATDIEAIKFLLKENQKLKKQLENCYCNRTDCSSRIKDSKKYDSLVQAKETQQKEFIEWLEAMRIMYQNEYKDVDVANHYNCVEKEYKEIIGLSDEKES